MENLREEYNRLSIEELKKVLNEAVLSPENEKICRDVLAEKMSGNPVQNTVKEYTQSEIANVKKRSPIDINTRSSYKTTRTIASTVSFLGWLCLVLGVFVMFSGISGSGSAARIELLSGIGIAFASLMVILNGQLIRANVDAADYCREILEEIRNR